MAETEGEALLRKSKKTMESDKALVDHLLEVMKRKEQQNTPSAPLPQPPNSWQELDEHSKKLIAGEKGLQLQKGILSSPYDLIHKFMTHGYNPGTNDTEGANNSAAIAAMLMGTGASIPKPSNSLGMVGGKPPSYFTPEKLNQLKVLHEEYKGIPGANKKIIQDFRTANPDIPEHIKDAYIVDVKNKNLSLGGINNATGAASTVNMGPGKESPFGAPAGSTSNTPIPKLNTESPAEAINQLQTMAPVTKDYVKALGEDMGLKVGEYMPKGYKKEGRIPTSKRTTYISLKDPDNPANRATVRVPGPNDKLRHYGLDEHNKGITRFDTGYAYPTEYQNKPNPRPVIPENTMNISNQSYAHPKELEEALRLQFFGKAPGGELRLVSPEYARLPKPQVNETPIPKPDPNQLKLLSGGYTPADILQILNQQSTNNGPQK